MQSSWMTLPCFDAFLITIEHEEVSCVRRGGEGSIFFFGEQRKVNCPGFACYDGRAASSEVCGRRIMNPEDPPRTT